MADPAVCMRSKSWIIADLEGVINNLEEAPRVMTYRSVLFPAPALRSTCLLASGTRWWLENIRFPWIHRSDPDAFHSVNLLLPRNHFAVPLCRNFEIKSWFVDESGGESQSRTNWSPNKIPSVYNDRQKKVWGKDQRVIFFVSSLFVRLWTAAKIRVTTARSSKLVNLSNLWRAVCISSSVHNNFTNFSVTRWASEVYLWLRSYWTVPGRFVWWLGQAPKVIQSLFCW